MPEPIVCVPKSLPRTQWLSAARLATAINPMNNAPIDRLSRVVKDFVPTPEHLAVLTNKYWHSGGVRLTVGFLDNPPADLRARILVHMNSWAASCNVSFTESAVSPQVRIARSDPSGGYWSYIGTDILSIDAGKPTMNLQGFTMDTPESEFRRALRHETGHTMGFPHEHMRRELVDKIDPDKALQYFEQTQGWSADEVRAQVLTPIEDSSLWGTDHADPNSIMCYQIPGAITKDGNPILGGLDIDDQDYAFAAKVYPPAVRSAPSTLHLTKSGSGVGVICFAAGTDPHYIAAVIAALSSAQ